MATLEDSSGDDSMIARDNKAVLFNDDYFIQVYGADEMFVTSKHGGTNKLFAANDLAFELGVIGEWEDF